MPHQTIYLSLGSNLGDREANLRAAIGRLAPLDVRVLRTSPVYETEPVDYTEQRWFLNLVVEAETGLFPIELLSRIDKIERKLDVLADGALSLIEQVPGSRFLTIHGKRLRALGDYSHP